MVENIFFLNVCLDRGNEGRMGGMLPKNVNFLLMGEISERGENGQGRFPPPQFPLVEYTNLLRDFFIKDIHK